VFFSEHSVVRGALTHDTARNHEFALWQANSAEFMAIIAYFQNGDRRPVSTSTPNFVNVSKRGRVMDIYFFQNGDRPPS